MAEIKDLLEFIRASPSPYHAVDQAAEILRLAGFHDLDMVDAWTTEPGHYFVRDGGAIVAWSDRGGQPSRSGFRIVGAHTDSPNLRIKARADLQSAGFQQLGVEVYGGALWNSWLDRDLGLSGRVVLEGEDTPRLLLIDEPLARIPQLAIHLDRDVNSAGLSLNPQVHLSPVWSLDARPGGFQAFVADRLGTEAERVMAWDLMLHDLTPPTLLGADRSLVAAPRLDNLLSCWAAISALSDVSMSEPADPPPVPVVCLFDHEEVGSASTTGAAGPLLESVLERIVGNASRRGSAPHGFEREALRRALARSVLVSADGAHATHPNYPERHDPRHEIRIDGGPVIKVNANQRYATDATTAAVFIEACERAGVPHQRFVTRNDIPCGSTIGPIAATRLGIATVDAGVAQLSMHSARELCGAEDPLRFTQALTRFLAG